MACQPQNLAALSYAKGFTLWYYKTADDISVVDNIGYFNQAAYMLRDGDGIFIKAAEDGAIRFVELNGTEVQLCSSKCHAQ